MKFFLEIDGKYYAGEQEGKFQTTEQKFVDNPQNAMVFMLSITDDGEPVVEPKIPYCPSRRGWTPVAAIVLRVKEGE